jgi:hypothetical protein
LSWVFLRSAAAAVFSGGMVPQLMIELCVFLKESLSGVVLLSLTSSVLSLSLSLSLSRLCRDHEVLFDEHRDGDGDVALCLSRWPEVTKAEIETVAEEQTGQDTVRRIVS